MRKRKSDTIQEQFHLFSLVEYCMHDHSLYIRQITQDARITMETGIAKSHIILSTMMKSFDDCNTSSANANSA